MLVRPALLAAVLITALVAPAAAQIRASERGTVSQTVDGTVITVDYSRPRIRGRDSVFATDLSAAHFDEQTGHLVLLSDESKRVMELDGNSGKLIGYRTLDSDFAGLGKAVPHGEGMTFDDRGNLYIVSEPNLFYRFNRG